MRRMLWMLLVGLNLVQAKDPTPDLDAYMFVDGVVTVSDAGKVLDHRITTEVDPQVQALVDGVIDRWLFAPVTLDGTPTPFTSRVRLTLHGLTTRRAGELMVRVEDVQFNDAQRGNEATGSRDMPIRYKKILKPTFPRDLSRKGVQAQTVVALQVDRQGKVRNQSIMYTDIVGTSDSESAMNDARKALERAVLRVVPYWTFEIDPDTFPRDSEYITVSTPITYSRFRTLDRWTAPGKWTILTRGQRRAVPWATQDTRIASLSESGSGTGLGVKLQTAPDGSPL